MTNPAPSSSRPTLEQTRRIAGLARMELDERSLADAQAQLAAVLGYVDRLHELDLEGVEPMAHPLDATNRVDDDTPRPALPRESLMAMAPQSAPPFIRVPRVLGDGSSA